MRNFWGCVRADLGRALSGIMFPLVVVLIAAINMLNMAEEYQMADGNTSVIYLFTNFANTDLGMVFICVGVLVFGLSFCEDWGHQYVRCILMRSGHAAYAWARVIVVAVSTFAAAFAGSMLTTGLLSIKLPALTEVEMSLGYDLYRQDSIGMLTAGSPVSYYAALSAVFAMNCMVWAVFALLVSAYQPNRLVAIAAPLTAYYFLIYFVPLPAVLSPSGSMSGYLAGMFKDSWIGLTVQGVLSVGLVCLMGCLFYRKLCARTAGE